MTTITPDRLPRADLLGEQVDVLVTLTYGGKTLRLATRDTVISSDDGDLVYDGALDDVEISEAMDLFETGASGQSVAITAVLPVDVAAMEAQGHSLSRSEAEIAYWIPGTLFEARRVVVVGRVSDPEYGADGEEVRFSIEDQPYDDTGLVPETTAVLSPATWDNGRIGDADFGRPYPTIIGLPGYNGAGSVYGSQAMWADTHSTFEILLLAGHPVASTTVVIRAEPESAGVEVDVVHMTDMLGRSCAVVDYRPKKYGVSSDPDYLGANYSGDAQNQILVSWQQGGGMLGPDGTAVRGAGDVLQWALEQSSLRVDRERLGATRTQLNAYLIDCVIDEATKPWDWLSANLLPILPISLVNGARGLYPIVWRYGATADDARARLDVGADPTIARAGDVKVDSTQIYNDFTVSYALDIRTGRYRYTAKVGRFVEDFARVVISGYNDDRILVTTRYAGLDGVAVSVASTGAGSGLGTTATEDLSTRIIELNFEPTVTHTQHVIDALNALTLVRAELCGGPGTRAWNDESSDGTDFQEYEYTLALPRASSPGSVACTISQDRYGVLSKSVELLVVYDDSTAEAIASWMAMAYALPRRTVTYVVGTEWAWLERGDVVTLTDPDLHLDTKVCLVQEIGVAGATVTLELLILDNPVRDPGSVAS